LGIDIDKRCRLVFRCMRRWTIKPGALLILMGVLSVIVLILILPQVDLPDTAFHRGTSPVVAHLRVSASPLLLAVRPGGQPADSAGPEESQLQHLWFSPSTSSFIPILHQSLRC